MEKCCISFGKFNSLFLKLIFSSTGLYISIIIFLILIDYAIGNEGDNIEKINFITYTVINNFCESLMIIPLFLLKKKIVSEKDKLPKKEKTNEIEKYIFNQTSMEFSKREKIYLILFSTLKLGLDIAYIQYILSFSISTDMKMKEVVVKMANYSSQFELIFLFLLSKIIYKMKFYKHQYCSLMAFTVISIIKQILLYSDKEIKEFFAYYFFDIAYSFFRSLMTVYIKGLMQYKYFSPYKISFVFGILNFFIATIALIILSFVPCNRDNDKCYYEYDEEKYFAHIFQIFRGFGLFLFIFLLIKAILSVLNYVVIHRFSVCHTILIIHLSQIIELYTFKKRAEKNEPKDIGYIVFVCVGVLIIGTILVLIFLEIIEVHIFGMDRNIRNNIEKRAMLDIELSDTNDDNECDAVEEIEQTNSKEESEET